MVISDMLYIMQHFNLNFISFFIVNTVVYHGVLKLRRAFTHWRLVKYQTHSEPMHISHLLHQYWKESYNASLIVKEHTKYRDPKIPPTKIPPSENSTQRKLG